RRLGRHWRRILEWKREPERGAPGHALSPGFAAVQPHDRTADRQAETHSGARALGRATTEFPEYALDVGFWNAATIVFDGNQNVPLATLRVETYHGARRRVLGAVLQQIAERLLDQRRVYAHERKVLRQIDDDPMRRHALGEAGEDRPSDLRERAPVALH